MSKFEIQPGSFLILDMTRVTGGVTYTRERSVPDCAVCGADVPADNQKCPSCGSLAEHVQIQTDRKIDHKIFVKDGQNFKQSALRCILRDLCANTALGWVCPSGNLPALSAAYAKLQEQAAEFNQRARWAGSAIDVTIGYVPVELTVDNEQAARFLAQTIREGCRELMTALRAGDIDALPNALRKCKNLERLAHGQLQRDAIVWAVEEAKEARSSLRAAQKADPKRDMSVIGKALVLESLEGCIAMFSEDAAEFSGPFAATSAESEAA